MSSSRLRRGKQILHEEGFLSFFKHAASFLLYVLFVYGKQCLYEHSLEGSGDIPDVRCQVGNVRLKSVFLPMTLLEYNNLALQGFDFLSHPDARNYEKRLVNGTIVFYAFTGDEFLFRTAMTTSRSEISPVYLRYYPPSIPEGHTACAGFSETAIKYRGKGIYTYVYAEIYRYLRQMGISRVLVLLNEEPLAAHRVQQRLGAKLLCKTYSVRLLRRFSFTWVKPISKSSVMQ